MKNILTTAGMAAAAVVGFQTTCAGQAVTVDDSKWWQVSAALRGFYDDNYTTGTKDQEQESFGVEVRPGLDLKHQGEQHTISFAVQYSARWFEDRARNEVDHTVLADLAAEYLCTENHVFRINDTFVYTSEGTLLDSDGVITTPTRTEGSNIRNYADLAYIGQLTPLIGLELGYENTLYAYEDDAYSAFLDRLEHRIKGETRWTITPTVAGIVGYWYEIVDFTEDAGEFRNSDSHYIVAGADYTMPPQTFFSVRGGAQNVMYDDAPAGTDDSEWTPFADVSATFEYLEDSYVRAGGRYGRNRTDADALDQETGTIYGVVNHKVTEALTARVSGQLQFGEFSQLGADETNENLYLVGLSLSYDINPNFAVEAGYNYDRVDSDNDQRTYSRNRVFLGVRGQF
jgi:predicted porin